MFRNTPQAWAIRIVGVVVIFAIIAIATAH